MEHRWGRRQAMDVPVRFVALPTTVGTGRVLNMSVTGAYLETAVALRRLSVLYLEPTAVPASGGRVRRIAASVVRHDARGVGLEWCDTEVEKSAGYTRLNALSAAAAAALAQADAPGHQAAESQSAESLQPVLGYGLEFLD